MHRLAGLLLLLAACSDPNPFAAAVFVSAEYQPVECDGGDTCLRVFSDIDGTAEGTGSCLLYAPTSDGQVAVAASGELELIPGRTVEWIVRVPTHLGGLGWNPQCVPTAEG